jgi:hypothetical protein
MGRNGKAEIKQQNDPLKLCCLISAFGFSLWSVFRLSIATCLKNVWDNGGEAQVELSKHPKWRSPWIRAGFIL